MMESLLALANADPDQGGIFLPTPASTFADEVDGLFMFITVLCTIFFILIVGAMAYFVAKYRRRSPDQRTSPNEGNLKLEIIWSVVPAILLVGIFVWSVQDYIMMRTPPADAMDVRVTARKWSWSYEYSNGVLSDKLVVPVERSVKLTMVSEDVIHSFYVPAFRAKQDVVPNRYSVLWFKATKPGLYDVECTEYCGDLHSQMLSTVEVKSQEDYDAWLDAGGPLGEVEETYKKGEILFGILGCNTCHNVDGSDNIGPPLNALYGGEETLQGGAKVKVDDDYIRDSILNPNAKIVEGYEPKMPTFKGRIKEQEISWIIDYMKSIGN